MPPEHPADADDRSLLAIFLVFLKLGLTSFGGPIAHLGYFREEFVTRRRWLDEQDYADLVALCQFIPGPASSQVGFALGVLRAGGLGGGVAAWCGFTLPSAAVLLGFALSASMFAGPAADGFIHGLKLVAVAVVAHAVHGMATKLTPDRPRIGIALGALALVIFIGGAAAQTAAIVLGMLLGLLFCRGSEPPMAGHLRLPVARGKALFALLLFAGLLLGLPVAAGASGWQGLALFDAFYRAGALVFGGGHVVLPLLQAEVVAPGWVPEASFLAGYGLAQAVPGPLFTLAAYLGAAMQPAPSGISGAAIALLAIFLPGILLVYGMLPFWDALRTRVAAQAAMRGANAAVVGILGAAFYDPIWTGAILRPEDFAAALAGFLLLSIWKTPSWIVVGLLAASGVLLAL